MSIVVSDTSPIRALNHLGLLNLLGELFGEVLVPPAVERELARATTRIPAIDLRPFAFVRVQAAQSPESIEALLAGLHEGESEALALAWEIKADAILIDEAAGRAVARQLGLAPLGVLGILLNAKQRGLIIEVRVVLDRLRSELGFFLSDALYGQVLRQAGE